MALKINVKDWFRTGLKPTQTQFWSFFDSIWFKEEQIPVEKIEGLAEAIGGKAEAEVLNYHLTDTNAHTAEFGAKEDKNKKGVAGGYAPLDEFTKLAASYLNIVNDLVTGGATALASAETVKTLKTQMDGINTLLASDNVNLDNVQELVDAIETIQTSLNTILVNDLTTGGTTKALTAEMGKVLNERLIFAEQKPITEDLFISTQIASSKLIYFTDSFRELDLQPYVGTTITNTNEIVFNNGDLYVGGNYSDNNTLPVFVMRIANCRISNNVLVFDTISYSLLGVPLHSLIFHNKFLYMASRTTQTTIYKVNPYNLSDIRTLVLPEDATFGGLTTDIIGYGNKIFILSGTNYYQTLKFIEIHEDLIQYRLVFTIPSISGYYTVYGNPFVIYGDEIYVPLAASTTSMAIRVYDLQGNVKRERTGIAINTMVYSTIAVPHWMSIYNNKIFITTIKCKSLVRLDCLTLATEESIALNFQATDDNSITKDGYLYLNGEGTPYEPSLVPKLVKVYYKNFLDYTTLQDPYNNGNGSYGSINPKLNQSNLNLDAKKNNYVNKAANYTILLSDFLNNNTLIVYVDATTAAVTITLPTAASYAGYEIKVIKTDATANTVTVKGNGSQLINAANTQVLSAQYSSLATRSNGTQSFII